MKRLVTNRSCLVLLNDEISQKRKFKQILNTLFEKNYRFFYFLNNSLASISASRLIKLEKGSTRCYYAFNHKLAPEDYTGFDAFLPIDENNFIGKIEWALKGCDAVITDYEYFDRDLKNKFSFELHKI